jgi:hypothetical protein
MQVDALLFRAGKARTTLHRGWPDREGREPMGQGWPAVAGALSAGRSRSSVVLGPLQCLAGELHSVPRRRDVRACEAVPGVRREARSGAPVHRAAGSAGETNLGTTSVAAPKASSSSTAIYSLTARPVASGGSPFSPSIPFCRFASALIRLASIAKASPPTRPSAMQRCRTVSKTRRRRSLSRKRPCRFFEKVE